jgi:hypothetical protein
MTEYNPSHALDELGELGTKVLSYAELLVKKKKVVEVAKMYALVKRESEKVESEARKMRLTGTLDVEVYKNLTSGYDTLGRSILEIAKSQWLVGDVHVLSRCYYKTIDKQWSSLAEYVRSEGER